MVNLNKNFLVLVDNSFKLENFSSWMSISEMVSSSPRFLPPAATVLVYYSPSNSRGYSHRPSNTKVVTPGPVQDNLKETTDKDYQVG